MAYLNFAEAIPTATGAVARKAKSASAHISTGFSPLEWSVIALARRDGLSSLSEPGRVAMALGSLFGTRRNPKLADPRLEALRRMAVMAWRRGYAVPLPEVAAFRAAGFTREQLQTLLSSIESGQAAAQRGINS
jgi:hypothetical protein